MGIEEIQKRYDNKLITAKEALKLIFDTYLISMETLIKHKLEIVHHGYGLWQLKQKGECLMEGERHECLERAKEIID